MGFNKGLISGRSWHLGPIFTLVAMAMLVGVVSISSVSADANYNFTMIQPSENPGIDIEKATNGEDADNPTGPTMLLGDVITWTYVVKGTGNVVLTNVVVIDDAGTPGNTLDDFAPTFVSGDTNKDGKLDLAETWEYKAPGMAKEGQYANVGYVTGDSPNGITLTDQDSSHYIGVIAQEEEVDEVDVCKNGRPIALKMLYTGDNESKTKHLQDQGKVRISGNPNFESPVRIVSSEKKNGSGRIYFDGVRNLGEEFVIDASKAGRKELKSQTLVLIENLDGTQLQTIEFHTSCSQSLKLRDQFGSIQVVGSIGTDENDDEEEGDDHDDDEHDDDRYDDDEDGDDRKKKRRK